MLAFILAMMGVLPIPIGGAPWDFHRWTQPWMCTRRDDTFFRT